MQGSLGNKYLENVYGSMWISRITIEFRTIDNPFVWLRTVQEIKSVIMRWTSMAFYQYLI